MGFFRSKNDLKDGIRKGNQALKCVVAWRPSLIFADFWKFRDFSEEGRKEGKNKRRKERQSNREMIERHEKTFLREASTHD